MATHISAAALVHAGVELGEDAMIDAWVVLGYPPAPDATGLALRIGCNAVIRSHTVIYAGSVIGDGFQTGHGALIRESNEIGDDVSVGSHSVVEHHVRLGDGVRIHSGAFIPEYSVLEEGSWVGPHAVFTNAPYPLSRDTKRTLRGPHLMRGAKIGANATLLPGVVIGVNSLVGAGAVVVRDVPDGVVVAGNPARFVRSIDDLAAYRTVISAPDEPAS
jgi:acetyltransferase-like isoleucine patch superfamily enzyme